MWDWRYRYGCLARNRKVQVRMSCAQQEGTGKESCAQQEGTGKDVLCATGWYW